MTAAAQKTEPSDSSYSVRLELVPADLVGEYEPDLREHLARACDTSRGQATPSGILELAAKGIVQLWMAREKSGEVVMVGVTEIRTFDHSDRKVIRCFLGAGKGLKQWFWALRHTEEWAKREGCTSIEVITQDSFSRFLPGYEKIVSTYSKEL
jgi:hypothetical protein